MMMDCKFENTYQNQSRQLSVLNKLISLIMRIFENEDFEEVTKFIQNDFSKLMK
jgi:hypothetical protein